MGDKPSPAVDLTKWVGDAMGCQATALSPAFRTRQADSCARFALDDGRDVFAKAAATPEHRRVLAAERLANASLPSSLGPRMLCWDDDTEKAASLIVFDDLGSHSGPPPWHGASVALVVKLLRRVAATEADQALPQLEQFRVQLDGWPRVAADPGPFLSLGLRSEHWLASRLEQLMILSSQAVLEGSRLVHFDVRSDNLFVGKRQARLVDWAWACRGSPGLDRVAWLPSMHAEGGPAPWAIEPDPDRPVLTLLAGYWASSAGLPIPPAAPDVRSLQFAQLRVMVDWLDQIGCP